VPVSVGEPGAVWELDPVLQAAQITVRLPTAIQRLTAATDRSLHSIPGGSGCADTGRVLGIPVHRPGGGYKPLTESGTLVPSDVATPSY
jgi:hypothetical protein